MSVSIRNNFSFGWENVEKTQMQILSIKYTEKCKGEAIVVETFTPV